MSPQPEKLSLSDSSTPAMSPLPEKLPLSDKSNSSSLPANVTTGKNYNLGSPMETESVTEKIPSKASPMDVEKETATETIPPVITPRSFKSTDESPSASGSVSEVKTPESKKSDFDIDSVEFVRS